MNTSARGQVLGRCVPPLLGYPRDGRWSPQALSTLLAHLDQQGGPALRELPLEQIVGGWSNLIAELSDSGSELRSRVRRSAAIDFKLSSPGLEAALDVVIAGSREPHLTRLAARAASLPLGSPLPASIVILPSNIPAIAMQILLPALLARRPLLLKMSSRESELSAALVAALHRHEPAFMDAIAVVTWVGGDRSVEDAIFRDRQIIAYGSRATCHDVSSRNLADPVMLSASLSFEVISSDADITDSAQAIVRDVTLFDQRGCLCPDAVYVDGDPQTLAMAIHHHLGRVALTCPPGESTTGQALAVYGFRSEAQMRGLEVLAHDVTAGTVVIDPDPTPRPSPGLRSIRIHPVSRLEELPQLLAPVRQSLQGCGLAGHRAIELDTDLRSLGFSRIAPAGELHDVPAGWANGGFDPLELFANDQPRSAG